MDSEEDSRDTGALKYSQLSREEILIIGGIEDRLREARKTRLEEPATEQDLDLAPVQNRHSRVLLLDGGRGTGKTSLLLTLVKRWRQRTTNSAEPACRPANKVKASANPDNEVLKAILENVPFHVTVIGNLDFDPLPPEMPVVAGIVQAWRPLAAEYDRLSGRDDESDQDSDTLMDLWHGLFRMAATGWSGVRSERGLIEQILDREEQVQDWLNFSKSWRSFIYKMIKTGICLKRVHRLDPEPVFVIIIDDCDLQVSRIGELLPALRLLYHERVFFLVAADRPHMIDMLKLDFIGQQNKLSRLRSVGDRNRTSWAEIGRWESSLAHSTFEKVFPKSNRWKLNKLSLLEFLAFPESVTKSKFDTTMSLPNSSTNFWTMLNKIEISPRPWNNDGGNDFQFAGDLILAFAQNADSANLPGVMTYRAAHQLREYVMALDASRPLEVLAGLLSSGYQTEATVVEEDGGSQVYVAQAGELAALYRPGLTEFAGYNIILGTQPDFAHIPYGGKTPVRMSASENDSINFTSILVAKALEEGGFPVDAAALRWETYLSLAWTEWRVPHASFSWTRHRHPRPDELLVQNREWSGFVKKRREKDNKIEGYAYAWVFYQRKWGRRPADPTLSPDQITDTQFPWDDLLKFDGLSTDKDIADEREWRTVTLPLLARPELGFPPDVQKRLLCQVPKDESVIFNLKKQRRRLITDAFVAAAAQIGGDISKTPDDKTIEDAIEFIDSEYRSRNQQKNHWVSEIEIPRDIKNKSQ